MQSKYIPLGSHYQYTIYIPGTADLCFICKQDVLHHLTGRIVPRRVQKTARKITVTL